MMEYITETTDFQIEEPAVVTIGKFDGRHRGHQKLLKQMLEVKAERGLKTAVFTFDINNVQRNAWFTPQVLSLSRATTTGFPDVSMTPTVGTPFLISKNGLLLPEHSWLSLYSSICAFPVFRLTTETV